MLEFIVGVAELEHRIRHLIAARKNIQYFLELDDTLVEISGNVVGLTQPVLRISGKTAVWILDEKRMEFDLGIFIATFL